jgi:uncharacterized protein
MSLNPDGAHNVATPHLDGSVEYAKARMAAIEHALSLRLGSTGVSTNLLSADEPDGVPVMRICIEGQEEIPVFVTASPSQVLCICYLWTEDEVRSERRAEMLEAMMDLNIAIPLSNFGRIGEHYVIYGSLAADADADSIAIDVAAAADNALEALVVFTEFLV